MSIGPRTIHDITAQNLSQVPAARGGNPIQFIVIHYLGVANADNPNLYGGGYGGHYNITRDGTIYKAADPRTAVVWQCGGGRQGYDEGSGKFFGICTNYNSIGIENGVNYDGTWYFSTETQESLVYLVSKLMDEYSIPIGHVIRHWDVTGKHCPAPYVENTGYKTNWTWNQFIQKLTDYRNSGGTGSTELKLGSTGKAVKTMQTKLIYCGYSCGKAGADGSFGPDTQKAVVKFQKDHGMAGDGIYGPNTDKNLNAAYKAAKAKKEAGSGTQASSLKNLSEADTVKKVGALFTADQKKSGILASVSLAQFILESGYGKTELAQKANNCFGMKKSLSGNTWSGSTWDGKSIYTKKTQEDDGSGNLYTITADFRKYPCIEDSVADHSAYLLGAKNGSSLRYAGLKGCKDYKKAFEIIKAGGYATDTKYVSKLCNIVEKWNLTQYDVAEKKKETFTPYMVRVSIPDLNIRTGPGTNYARTQYIPIGAYTIVEEKAGQGSAAGWGRLKSGAGWISLDFCQRI